jgi:hypothetical protein
MKSGRDASMSVRTAGNVFSVNPWEDVMATIVSGPLTARSLCCITDDVLWRATRRANRTLNKERLSTRRGPVHSNGWLSRPVVPFRVDFLVSRKLWIQDVHDLITVNDASKAFSVAEELLRSLHRRIREIVRGQNNCTRVEPMRSFNTADNGFLADAAFE